MAPAKSVLMGVSAGLVAYFFAANVGGGLLSRDLGATIGDTVGTEVTADVTPGDTVVTGGAKSVGTKVTGGAKSVTPGVTPVGTTLTPVTPRPTTPLSASPSVTITPSATPIVPRTNTPTPTPSPSVSVSPSLTPIPSPLNPSHVVINEIAWAGTATSSADEWIELYNAGSGPQDLAGWYLCAGTNKVAAFTAAHTIGAGAYFLMERTDDSTVSDIAGDYVGPFSKSLTDGGLDLTLRSGTCAEGAIVDEVGPGLWYAGNTAQRATMERISADSVGNNPSNWATWGTVTDGDGNTVSTGLDAAGNPLNGTPKYRNSVAE